MACDSREAKGAREDLPGLRRYAPKVYSAHPGRESTGSNATSGSANHLTADDREGSVAANGPLHACSAEVCDAAGCAVAAIARKPGRWPQAAAAVPKRNAGSNR